MTDLDLLTFASAERDARDVLSRSNPSQGDYGQRWANASVAAAKAIATATGKPLRGCVEEAAEVVAYLRDRGL